MKKLNDDVKTYVRLLQQGQLQRAYRGILTFMGDLNRQWKKNHPRWITGSVYPGYMDMTYFPTTPPDLKDLGLKIALVYLHRENRFEGWLSGMNRSIQSKYVDWFQNRPTPYKLTPPGPGVDSILVCTLVDQPDFDAPEVVMNQIMETTLVFLRFL